MTCHFTFLFMAPVSDMGLFDVREYRCRVRLVAGVCFTFSCSCSCPFFLFFCISNTRRARGASFSIGVLARSSKSRAREGRKEETFRLATTLFMLCQNFFFFFSIAFMILCFIFSSLLHFADSFLSSFSLSLSPCHVCICIDLGVQWW